MNHTSTEMGLGDDAIPSTNPHPQATPLGGARYYAKAANDEQQHQQTDDELKAAVKNILLSKRFNSTKPNGSKPEHGMKRPRLNETTAPATTIPPPSTSACSPRKKKTSIITAKSITSPNSSKMPSRLLEVIKRRQQERQRSPSPEILVFNDDGEAELALTEEIDYYEEDYDDEEVDMVHQEAEEEEDDVDEKDPVAQAIAWDAHFIGEPVPKSATPYKDCTDESCPDEFYETVRVLKQEYYVDDSSSGGSDTSSADASLKARRKKRNAVTRDDEDAYQTYHVGGWVLVEYFRDKNDLHDAGVAVCQIYAMYKDDDGLPVFIPRWGMMWEDIVVGHDDPLKPDKWMKHSRQVYLQLEHTNDKPGVNQIVARGMDNNEDVNHCHNILRHATVRHMDDFPPNSPEFDQYIQSPDCYYYRYGIPRRNSLRFEYIPPPPSSSEDDDNGDYYSRLMRASTAIREYIPKRIQPTVGDNDAINPELGMCDVFAGVGTLSLSSAVSGFKATVGIEKETFPFAALSRNLDAVGQPQAAGLGAMTLEEFIEKLQTHRRNMRRGVGTNSIDDELLPRPGQVAYLHLSPPCQCLSKINAHAGLDRYQEELVPLIEQIVQLIDLLEPKFITVEEVEGFMKSTPPRIQYTRRPTKDTKSKEEVVRVTVRPWLLLIPNLLQKGWQVDLRLLNAAHYGVPQARIRLIIFAAKAGYQLPVPPAPRYHCDDYSGVRGLWCNDRNMPIIDNLSDLTIESDPCILPLAVTADEAISDLPLLYDPSSNSLRACRSGLYQPRNPNCISRYALFMRQGASPLLQDHCRYPRVMGRRVDPSKHFPTVIGGQDGNCGKIHPIEDRSLTVLENKRGQSMPDRWFMEGNVLERFKMVGNAVPYLMALAITDAVYEAATGVKPASTVPYLKGYVDADGNEVDKEALDNELPRHDRGANRARVVDVVEQQQQQQPVVEEDDAQMMMLDTAHEKEQQQQVQQVQQMQQPVKPEPQQQLPCSRQNEDTEIEVIDLVSDSDEEPDTVGSDASQVIVVTSTDTGA